MLRIGDFSRLGHVTVVTLRHYDQLGLLKPEKVDRETGYRYYTAGQLPRLHRILILKDLGFNLEQIARLIDDNLSVEQMIGMLKLRHAEVEQQMQAEQQRLARIETRLNQLQTDRNLPDYEVVIKEIEPLKVLAIRDRINVYPEARRLLRELKDHLEKHGFGWSYPNLTLWEEVAYQERDIAVEVATPFEGRLPLTSRIQSYTLPGVATMACALHQGDYEDLTAAYAAIIKWSEAHNYQLGSPFREVYLHYEKGNPSANITEIQFSVEKI